MHTRKRWEIILHYFSYCISICIYKYTSASIYVHLHICMYGYAGKHSLSTSYLEYVVIHAIRLARPLTAHPPPLALDNRRNRRCRL